MRREHQFADGERHWFSLAASESVALGATETMVLGPVPEGSRIEVLELGAATGTAATSTIRVFAAAQAGTAATTGNEDIRLFPRNQETVLLPISVHKMNILLEHVDLPQGTEFLRIVISNGIGAATTYSAVARCSMPPGPLP